MVRTLKTAREAAAQKSKSRTAIASDAPKKAIVKTEKVKTDKAKTKKAAEAEPEEEPAAKEKKAHRWRPGTVALREIRKEQGETKYAIKKAPFRRLVRETVTDVLGANQSLRITETAFEALQAATEGELVRFMNESLLNMVHARRRTLLLHDVRRSLSSHNRFCGGNLQYPVGNSEDPGKAAVDAAVEARAKAPRKSPPKRNPVAAKVLGRDDAPKEPEVASQGEPEAEEPAADKPADATVPASEEY